MDWIGKYFKNKWDLNHNSGKKKPDISEILKLSRLTKVPHKAKLLSRLDMDDYIREDYYLDSEEFYKIPLTVLIPKRNIKKTPIISLHGHGGGGRLGVIGDRTDSDVAAAIDKYNYDYGLKLVKRGYTVFCPDSRGFGDSRSKEYSNAITSCSCRELSNLALSLGLSLTGMMVFDVITLIDYIKDYFLMDITELSCIGFSGGGALTLYSSIIDPRIKNIIISGYMYGFKESLLELHGNCSCNYIPNMWLYYDMKDLASLILAKNIFIESGDRDHLNGKSQIKNVLSQVENIKSPSNFVHKIYSGPHKFYGLDCFDWLSQLRH
ncbi:hypothetical protein EW093_06230 [Thiospirochaeta perfilievii]|uniref:Acetyl xylan esterase domain-containing protein n=1 Tax=Thiospirochaeta perfilievii TaxID=252967 RepID=A0A5C1QCB7_9SPIO|nr:alpha/beta hydrolase [Thiospirochaeta perfilievii]QEN04314.1 hypothetical protein EW093_06230 [Thiospirochaeta perfilievii]